jgi:lipopolysaccharide export LptBFGC system permease protein LptF
MIQNIIETAIYIMFVIFLVSLIVNTVLVLKGKIDHWAYPAFFAIFTTLLAIVAILIQYNA